MVLRIGSIYCVSPLMTWRKTSIRNNNKKNMKTTNERSVFADRRTSDEFSPLSAITQLGLDKSHNKNNLTESGNNSFDTMSSFIRDPQNYSMMI